MARAIISQGSPRVGVGFRGINAGKEDAGSFWPVDSDFSEVWRWDMASGNLVSRIFSQTYTKTGTGGTYNAGGPTNTDLDSYSHQSEYWVQAAPNAAVQPRLTSFVWVTVFKCDTRLDQVWYDHDSHIGTQEGLYIGDINDASGLYILVDDGTLAAQYNWTVANGWAAQACDGNWHHLRVILNKSNTLPTVELDGTAKTVTKASGSDLNLIGDIQPAGGLALGGQENNGGRRFKSGFRCAYQAVKTNSTTANSPLLP